MKNYIEYLYRGQRHLIAKNSDAYLLWEAKQFKHLDAHIALLEKAEQLRQDSY